MQNSQLDLRGLLHALVNPTSNEQYHHNQQTMSNLFKEPGFFIALQALAADHNLSSQERLMASLITGRELKIKWRSKALVPEALKPEVRERLFGFLAEQDLGIARPQLGLLAAVARIEFPRAFPNLPTLLLNPLLTCVSQINSASSSSTTSTILLNTLWAINAVVKEWKGVKLASGAEVMRTLEQVFVAPVGRVLELWAEKEKKGEGDWVLGEAGRYAFKILARFGHWHWGKAKQLQSQEALQHIQALVHHSVALAPIIQARRARIISDQSLGSSSERTKLLRSLIKHLRAIGKWWRAMISTDPKGYCNIDGATNGIGWWWGEVGGVVAGSDGAVASDDSDDVTYPKRYLLLGMLLFKDIIPILAVDHPDIFTPSFVLSALHLLVDKLLPLTSNDLETLEDEPEEWVVNENKGEEAWAFEFRPCAERVLMALNNATRHIPVDQKVIEPEMLKILAQAEAIPPDDLPSIIRREAVYCALGRMSRSISGVNGMDFNALLNGIGEWIGQDLPLHRILKRRVAWLIGQWVSADEECAKLSMVWQILLHLLAERGEASDRAVNLTAALGIKECCDLWEMDIDYFLPYLQQMMQELIKLLGEATTLDGKRYVNDTIGVLIERVGDKIMPYLPTLAQAIPGLWQSANGLEGELLFKASLVVLTTKLVSAARESSGNLMSLVIPLIEESLVPPAKDFFEEDSLILWQAAMHNAISPYQPTPEAGLIRLLPGLLNILSEHTEHFSKLLALLDSYILIDASNLVQNYGDAICTTLFKLVTVPKLPAANVRSILNTVSLLVRTAPLSRLASQLVDAGIFQHILTALEDDKASGIILASYLEILSRIAMADPDTFLQMVVETGRRQNTDGAKVLETVLDAMWRNFDYVSEQRMRKAVAMGAGALLMTGNTQVLERLDGEFMNIFLDVLGEVQVSQDDPKASELSVRHWRDDNPLLWSEIQDTQEGKRRSALEDTDPAFATPLKAYVISVLTQGQNVGLGPYWEKADEGTKKSLTKFLS
ncbi:importin-11, partial [Tremellales sp. Uapishka_1]